MTPEFLAIGHLTDDLQPTGERTCGGTVLYAAATAQRLGLRAAVFSAGPDTPRETLPEGVAYVAAPAPERSTFANSYSAAGRTQVLHAAGTPIDLTALPADWQAAPMVLLGPVLQECDLAWVEHFPNALVAATPQGWMRTWDPPLPAPIRRVDWEPPAALLAQLSLLVVSEEDVAGDLTPVRAWAQECPLVALTRGSAGATLFVRGAPHRIAAWPAIERDPTGAGDVFATALLIRLYQTGDPLAAARFAAYVAARSVERSGIAGIRHAVLCMADGM
jgi:sugar/nucleoside kinase (ribokinase family)